MILLYALQVAVVLALAAAGLALALARLAQTHKKTAAYGGGRRRLSHRVACVASQAYPEADPPAIP